MCNEKISQEMVIGEELVQEANCFKFDIQERLFAIIYSVNPCLADQPAWVGNNK